MKHLRETFTEEEWKTLIEAKLESNMNWHDLILKAIPEFVEEYCHKPITQKEALRITKDLIEDSKFEIHRPAKMNP